MIVTLNVEGKAHNQHGSVTFITHNNMNNDSMNTEDTLSWFSSFMYTFVAQQLESTGTEIIKKSFFQRHQYLSTHQLKEWKVAKSLSCLMHNHQE